jgi:protease-4
MKIMLKGKLTLVIFGGIFLVLFVIIISVIALLTAGEGVALVEVTGPIYSSRQVVDQLQKHKDDQFIKAIVLRINSPGGAVAPVQEIHRELNKIQKSVVVSMGSIATSGGYYIASAADWIFANPGTLTGSIGVIMQFPKWEELMKKVGVEQEIIKSGKYKDAGSIYRKLTSEEKELFQATIDDVHDQFLEAVLEGRQHKELTREEIEEIADGRLMSGRQALEGKLIDQLGDMNDAIEYAGKLAGIKGKPRVIQIKTRRSILERLIGDILGRELGRIIHDQSPLRYELPL